MLQIETHSPNTPLWVRHIQHSTNGIGKHLSALAEIKETRWRHKIWKEIDYSGNIKHRRRKIWIKWLNSLNKKYHQRCKDFLDTGKDKTITIKIKYLQQNAINFTTFSDRKILM